MNRRDANLLRAFALWTVLVWGRFVWSIIIDGSQSTGFKVVHGVLAAVSIAFAVATWFVVARNRRFGRRDIPDA